MIIAEIPTEYNYEPIQLCSVQYDRKDKTFIVANGAEITRVPANGYKDRNAKELASLLALEFDRPDLVQMVKQTFSDYLLHPDVQAIKSRAIRAGFIVRDGLVDLDPPAYLPDVAQVVSQSGSGEIHSVWENGRDDLACSCYDWRNGESRARMTEGNPNRPRFGAPEIYPGRIDCKHIMAYLMALQIQNQLSRTSTDW